MLRSVILVCSLIIIGPVFSQTGPAGVGTSASNVLWLKADAGTSTTTNGAAVSSWTDQSGNGVVLSQTNSVQQPLFTSALMNGFPAIEFDNNSTSGQNDYFISPDNPIFDNTNGYSFFTVTRMKGLGTAQSIVSKRNNVGNEEAFMIFFYTNNEFYADIDNDNNRFSNGVANTVNTNKIYDVFYDGTLAPNQRSTMYQQEQLQMTSHESSYLVADKSSPLIVGATHTGDPRAFNGYISEVIVYRTKVNTAQRIIINNHLSAKYDIALTANDMYLGDNPANGNYDRDVAGIGQDATGASNTVFAPSASAGLGIQSVSGLDNQDYILVGHAFPVNSEQTTDVAGITGTNVSRWQRIWYIDVTNTGANNVTNMTFDMSDGGMTGVNLGVVSNYILVYRAAQTGPWTEIATATSITGDQILFSNQSLTLDGYYTLATKDFSLSPLPVTLTYFNAVPVDRTVELTWQTESEANSAYFDVQRSVDGSVWNTVGIVAAQGTSVQTVNYELVDNELLNGISYYRLKLVDQDGDFEYSDVRAVSFTPTTNKVDIYPNPANSGIFTIQSEDDIRELEIMNALGERVYRQTSEAGKTIVLHLPELRAGSYFVIVNGEQFKLVIL